jgi:hypothetical protein
VLECKRLLRNTLAFDQPARICGSGEPVIARRQKDNEIQVAT